MVGVERAEVVPVAIPKLDAGTGPGVGKLAPLGIGAPGVAGERAAPVSVAVSAGERRDPRWEWGERQVVGPVACSPFVPSIRRMDARWDDHQAALRSQLDPRSDRGRREEPAGRIEPDVLPAPAGQRPRARRKRSPAILELGERAVPAVSRIDVEHDRAGHEPGHDTHVRGRPAPPPGRHLVHAGAGRAPRLPRDAGVLGDGGAVGASARAAAAGRPVDRNHRPAAPR